MLTSDQSIVSYERGRAIPDRLTRITHRHYLHYAQRMLAVYGSGVGTARRQLHRSVANILADEPECPRRRVAALCKVLDDAAEFDTDRMGEAAKLRLRVFELSAARHPLVGEPDHIFERTEAETKRWIAAELGRPWEQIDSALYLDVIDRQPMRVAPAIDSPESLLSRYNLAQLQACLYKAVRMTVLASSDFAAIVRYAKLSRLLVEARRVSPRQYRIELSGPASVLHETRRYGVNFARFIAALIACRGWRMSARVAMPWRSSAQLQLSSEDGYRSHVPSPADFDSGVERSLAEAWGESRGGWRLVREAGILQHAQTTFVPDFLLRHDDGREALLEIVGFWTPEYLSAKRKTIACFAGHRILLAIPRRTAKEEVEAPGVIVYRARIKPEQVVEALAGMVW